MVFPMNLTELAKTIVRSPGQAELRVPADWMQGRSVFGGLQAGLAVAAMRTLVPTLPLRTLQATFMAPLAGETLQAQAFVLRTGKNTVHVEARLIEDDQTLGIVVGVFGAARSSSVVRMLTPPEIATTSSTLFKYLPGLTPTFTQHFSANWLRGGLPFSASTLPECSVMLGMKDSGLSTEMHVLALADFIPPVALSLLNKPAAGSTLTWMLEFLTTELSGLALQGWRVDAEMLAAAEGYTSQTVTLWGPDGQAVALSRQNMVVFA